MKTPLGWLCAAALWSLAGCTHVAGPSARSSGPATLTVMVLDETGAPAPNVLVTVAGCCEVGGSQCEPIRTDPRGRAGFEVCTRDGEWLVGVTVIPNYWRYQRVPVQHVVVSGATYATTALVLHPAIPLSLE